MVYYIHTRQNSVVWTLMEPITNKNTKMNISTVVDLFQQFPSIKSTHIS